MNQMTTYKVLELLAAAGESGLTTTDIAQEFDLPDTHQKRSNRASQVLRTLSKSGCSRRGEREPTSIAAARGAPVYRWYSTPQAVVFLASGNAADRARRRDERIEHWQRVSEAATQQREAALSNVRAEIIQHGGKVTKCWRYDKIVELRQVPCSLQEIGDVFGITRERVRQIEAGREDPCNCPACHAAMIRGLSG